MIAKTRYSFILITVFLCSFDTESKEIPAFPGAEGHGMYTAGGRGGRVIKVRNLNDSGDGSLRAAIEAQGPRIVIFEVSGTIELKSRLKIQNGNLTIAGHTAPGDGICLKNYEVYLDACEEVIIRYLRFRMGDEARQQGDAIGGQKNRNVIIDHCSASWSTDECASFYANENFTMQWCLIAESLRNSVHKGGKHGFGGVWGGKNASFHHNLLAHHDSRNPRLGEYVSSYALSDLVDLRNNVIYNWQGNSCYGGEGMNVNMVNNYYKPGPATVKNQERIIAVWNRVETWDPLYNVWGKFHIEGNKLIGSERATKDNWRFGVQFDSKWKHMSEDDKQILRLESPLEAGTVTTHSAEEAYQKVLQFAGASVKRDLVDQRIIHDVASGTASFQEGGNGSTDGFIDSQAAVGGWPELKSLPAPVDTDDDGMPDEWELANGLNPDDSKDGIEDINNDGYTNVEDYLNSLSLQYYDTRPLVSFVNPKRNEVFITANEAIIQVEAHANDYNGGSISEMELYLDQRKIKRLENSHDIAATLTSVSPGFHEILVKVEDNSGNVSRERIPVFVGKRKVKVTIEEDVPNGHVELEPEGRLYADDIPVQATAIPKKGYRFHSWIGDVESEERVLTIKTDRDLTLKPVFVSEANPVELYRKPIRISFGPLEGFYAPPGYQADGGAPYGEKLSGYTYGWFEGYNMSGSVDDFQSNLLLATCNVFETERSSFSWGIALPAGLYNVRLGLGTRGPQGTVNVSVGQLRADGAKISIHEQIGVGEYKEYLLEKVELKDGGTVLSDVRLSLSSVNQTEIYFIEIESLRIDGLRTLRVTSGTGSGRYYAFGKPVMIVADPPTEGMVFDRWVGNTEPQYFEGVDQWYHSSEYIGDIYSPTTFVTRLDYVTSVTATYKEKR
ncbi:hypothetical protein OAE97_01405 [Verrucomicrobia bacterium]|nr:hypothetical protein [Verrucomicrobiota bacterium]